MFSPIIIVSREEMIAKDTSSVLDALRALVASPDTALNYFESIDIAFHGYNEWREELFEIQEVREFVHSTVTTNGVKNCSRFKKSGNSSMRLMNNSRTGCSF